ncbi:MAG: O-antigen ligase family protein, partial [Clostridia bacterium]|nr:O-antigen ligase family protein [Clostridia bacterium]
PIVFQVRSIGVFYILYFVVRTLRFGKREFVLLVDVLQGMAAVLFLFGAIEKITSKTVLFPAFVSEKILYASNFARVYGLLANPNTYALFLVLVLFLSVFRRLLFQTPTSPAVYGLMLCSLLLTMSRSGALALGMGLLALGVYVLVKQRRTFPFKAFGASLAITLLIGFGGYFGIKEGATLYYNAVIAPPKVSVQETDPKPSDPSGETTAPVTPPTTAAPKPTPPEGTVDLGTSDRFDDMFSNKELANSLADGRLFFIKNGLQVLKDHPVFGAGFSAFGSAATLSYSSPIAKTYGLPTSFYADNEYIKVLAENGLVGFLLFAAFLLAALWRYRKCFFKVFLMFVLAWFGLFFNIFEVQIGTMILWTMLAMHIPCEKEKGDLA